MFAYSVCFALVSAGAVFDNFAQGYFIIYNIWSAFFYAAVSAGNILYSMRYSSGWVRRSGKVIFPLLILDFIVGWIVDSVYGESAKMPSSWIREVVLLVVTLAVFFPTLRAHYLIGYTNQPPDSPLPGS